MNFVLFIKQNPGKVKKKLAAGWLRGVLRHFIIQLSDINGQLVRS